MSHSIPPAVLAAFDIGRVNAVKTISVGLIHQTYQIETERGIYILQRLHPVLASKETAEDFLAVTRFLNENTFLAPQCVLSKSGTVLVHDTEDRVWRMQTSIPGESHERATDEAMAREAGVIYARFHRVMDRMPHVFKSTREMHETHKLFLAFREVVEAHQSSDLMDEARADVAFVMDELPKIFLPDDLPMRVIHGDPKISNILFDKKAKAVTIVDLDTCGRRPIAVELGDAFRSWCGVEEDDPKNSFRLDVFRAGWKGYASEAKGFLTAREVELVPQAIGTITLELASRFLADYFSDSYFGWDQKRYPSRRAHNLARARGQIALYKDLQERMKEVIQIIR